VCVAADSAAADDPTLRFGLLAAVVMLACVLCRGSSQIPRATPFQPDVETGLLPSIRPSGWRNRVENAPSRVVGRAPAHPIAGALCLFHAASEPPSSCSRRRTAAVGTTMRRPMRIERISPVCTALYATPLLSPSAFATSSTCIVGWLAASGTSEMVTGSPVSEHSYDRNLRLHVLPHLGSVELRRVDAGMLNALYAALLADGKLTTANGGSGGLSPRSVRYIHTIVHRAFRDAVR
jgi:hypothetical protein